jgi:lipopolysaccharide/colanic/teichoic acid biosynthesis glycosyltransferase
MIDHFENTDPEKNNYLKKYKRLFDLLLAIILLLVTAPILIIAAILIKISSKGPVIYKQQRVGIYGKLFVCYKFRSMYHSVEDDESKTVRKSSSKRRGVLDKRKDDERITRIGSFLRKTSIDELPQLFNVLKGDMSLVGPRPLLPFMLEPFPEIKRKRCKVLPGITGLWQVKGRKNNTQVLDMINYDLEYILKVNFAFDIYILLLTIYVVMHAEGAY